MPLIRPDLTGERYFYQQIRASTAAVGVAELALTIRTYLTRSVRSAWWMLECYANLPLLAETRWGRRILDRELARSYAQHGLDSPGLSVLDRERAGLGTSYVVDIGVDGEPRAPGYRHLRDMRELQRLVDAPSLWGVSYLTPAELRAARVVDYERYERVRERYQADSASLSLNDKVVWIRPDTPDRGKMPLWRAYRTFGPRWYWNPLAHVVLMLALLSSLIWTGWVRSLIWTGWVRLTESLGPGVD
jgi:hypothetical protein